MLSVELSRGGGAHPPDPPAKMIIIEIWYISIRKFKKFMKVCTFAWGFGGAAAPPPGEFFSLISMYGSASLTYPQTTTPCGVPGRHPCALRSSEEEGKEADEERGKTGEKEQGKMRKKPEGEGRVLRRGWAT